MAKVKVKFIKSVSGIEEGTIKNLPLSTANGCVKLGVAEFVKETTKKRTSTKK